MEAKMLAEKKFNAIPAPLAFCLCLLLIVGLCPPAALAQSASTTDSNTAATNSSAAPEENEGQRASMEDIQSFVTVMDRDLVADIFGSRISKRFIAFQVTIQNMNENLQFLIHDISLDLEKVFAPKEESSTSEDSAQIQKDVSPQSKNIRTAP